MENRSFQLVDGKVIIRIKDRACDTPEELLASRLFYTILRRAIRELAKKNSRFLAIFADPEIREQDVRLLIKTLQFLAKLPIAHVVKLVDGAEQFSRDIDLFSQFVEYLYNYWRNLGRLVICDSEGNRFDKRPYRTFNQTIEQLTHLVRGTYREIQENITGDHPRIYRQVPAGGGIATIALPRRLSLPDYLNDKLEHIPVIRQVLLYPPLIFTPPMNKRSGMFEQVEQNPAENLDFRREDWLCYPAMVGPQLILIYFSMRFFEHGFTLSNLFELADDKALEKTPDAVYFFGIPDAQFPKIGNSQTIFYDDDEHNILIGALPDKDEFSYFGYLKKMVLTLHNIRMMKQGRLPFHGALVHLMLRGQRGYTVLVMGDTGAGKSETLEALRLIGSDDLEDVIIIADDMGSLEIDSAGRLRGYGTEIGAFVRLDDLNPGYAFGQIDRTIIMSPNEVNARVVLPVTTYKTVVQGYPVDLVLYANNYEAVDGEHSAIERFTELEFAFETFRAGAVMSKGTTTTQGKVGTYFANVFGPAQYIEEHDVLARRYFGQLFTSGTYVGQMRTQLGISGLEMTGPEQSARALLDLLKSGEIS
ncbi:MAG: phosphoenolpyruvate carboxykinase [Chloroflexi bacterium HGW-Chloroflexi-6]|nr:MAG: phosphoenolpyruvate carboxykinase [Chloroflexi bacterium HGW-Chloroflexi-6]